MSAEEIRKALIGDKHGLTYQTSAEFHWQIRVLADLLVQVVDSLALAGQINSDTHYTAYRQIMKELSNPVKSVLTQKNLQENK